MRKSFVFFQSEQKFDRCLKYPTRENVYFPIPFCISFFFLREMDKRKIACLKVNFLGSTV